MALATAVALAFAACGDTSPEAEDEDPGAGDAPGGLQASCGGVAFDSVPADPSRLEPVGAVWAEVDLTNIGMEADFWDLYDWSIATQSDEELGLFGTPIKPTTVEGEPQYASARLDREGDRWTPHSWGQCRIELAAPGYGPARFVLDPDHEPDPDATTLAVQATEMSCAGGEAPAGRDVRSVVVAQDDTSVSIVVLVEPPTGNSTCPGNPSFPFEVDLGAPLGDRAVLDAGQQPAIPRPWPPTESSIESMGLAE